MPFLTQSRFPGLWLLFQRYLGGLKDKQVLAMSAWDGHRRILEVGCSVGNIAEVFCPLHGISYTGIDIDEKVIHVARSRFAHEQALRFLWGSVEEHAASRAQYDYILVAGMLHHVDDTTALALLRELRPLSAPGATIVIYDPDASSPEDPLYMRLFSMLDRGGYMRASTDIEKLVSEAGMAIRKKELSLIHPGLPGFPPVARFATFVAAWDAV